MNLSCKPLSRTARTVQHHSKPRRVQIHMNELQQRFLELTDNKKLRDIVCSLSNYPPGCLAQAGELWNDFATNNPAKPEDIISFIAWCPVHRRPLDRVELAKLIESNSGYHGAIGMSPFNGFLLDHKTFGEIEARLFPFAPRRICNLILCQACRESKLGLREWPNRISKTSVSSRQAICSK